MAHITNRLGGIVNSYEYDAFGRTLSATEGIPNRFRYAGEQFDHTTEQYYLRARFYNPVIARFTQEDEYRGDGLNLYAYVGNNPINYVDPSGYSSQSVGCGGGGKKEGPFEGTQQADQKTEKFYRVMSEKEFIKLEKNDGILTKRVEGKSELKITDDPHYGSGDLSKRKSQKSRNYTRFVEFEVEPGTKDTLINQFGGTHESTRNHPDYSHLPVHKDGLVEVKFERGDVLSLGLGSSEKGLEFFNKQRVSWREK